MTTKLEANDIDMVVDNSGRLQYGRRRDGMVVESSTGVLSWANIANICPLEPQVLDGVVYGDKTGSLGRINTNDSDISKQIADNIKFEITNLYPTLNELDYLEEVSQNNFRGNTDRYGIRELSLNPTNEIVGRESIDRTYEIVLTTDYVNKKGSDLKQREAKQALIAKMELIRRKMRITKAGSYTNVRITRDFNEPEVEFLDDNNVAVCRAEITVNYRVNNA